MESASSTLSNKIFIDNADKIWNQSPTIIKQCTPFIWEIGDFKWLSSTIPNLDENVWFSNGKSKMASNH